MLESIRFTAKQIEILHIIKKGNPDKTPVSVYDIIDKLSYECKRDALLHSIRVLVNGGFVERRDLVKRGKEKPVRVFMVTTKALDFV